MKSRGSSWTPREHLEDLGGIWEDPAWLVFSVERGWKIWKGDEIVIVQQWRLPQKPSGRPQVGAFFAVFPGSLATYSAVAWDGVESEW